jgi:hypothetical protein
MNFPGFFVRFNLTPDCLLLEHMNNYLFFGEYSILFFLILP